MPPGRGGQDAVKTEIYVTKPFVFDKLESMDIESDEFREAIVARAFSSDDGSFSIELEDGEYSVLVNDRDIDGAGWRRGFHPKSFGENGYAGYVKVKKGEVKELDILIDHAVY